MKLRLPMAVAILSGAITLITFFIPTEPLPGVDLRVLFVEWASTLAAVALLIGILNLAAVHLRKVGAGSPGWFYSAFLLLALIIVLGAGMLGLLRSAPGLERLGEAGQSTTRFAFVYIQTPMEAALAALLAVILLVAGARLIRVKRNWAAVLFVLTALILILGLAPINLPVLNGLPAVRNWVMEVPAAGGARGILLGIALGVVTTGLRVIIGAEHPYGE